MRAHMRPVADGASIAFTVELTAEELKQSRQEPAVLLGAALDAVRALVEPPGPTDVPGEDDMEEPEAPPRHSVRRPRHQEL